MIHASPQLIAAANKGDEKAIVQLLVTCQPDLHRFARKTCRTSEDAEDAVQVALWAIHKKITTLQHIAAFATWLFRIIERECYRIFRRMKPEEQLMESADLVITMPTDSHDLCVDLSRSIALLPDIYRAVLIFRDIEELTAPEVAEHLNISIEAVKSRLHRARTMIRQHLKAGGYKITG